MVSICMAVKNGAQFVREQIDSILHQLGAEDELIISDDGSTDGSIDIVMSYNDPRIRLHFNSNPGIIANFENSLRLSKGEFIFLCDQDDVWHPQKIKSVLVYLKQCDLVVSDCFITMKDNQHLSFFKINRSGKGLVRNLMRNSYMGCCMAFNRKVLLKALPFPNQIPMHDLWIGLIAELYFHVRFVPDQLVYHRRHHNNASTTSRPSQHSLARKVGFRYQLIKNLIQLPVCVI
jgi:glycosyltransferase involved in cell wall biosynthesis